MSQGKYLSHSSNEKLCGLRNKSSLARQCTHGIDRLNALILYHFETSNSNVSTSIRSTLEGFLPPRTEIRKALSPGSISTVATSPPAFSPFLPSGFVSKRPNLQYLYRVRFDTEKQRVKNNKEKYLLHGLSDLQESDHQTTEKAIWKEVELELSIVLHVCSIIQPSYVLVCLFQPSHKC